MARFDTPKQNNYVIVVFFFCVFSLVVTILLIAVGACSLLGLTWLLGWHGRSVCNALCRGFDRHKLIANEPKAPSHDDDDDNLNLSSSSERWHELQEDNQNSSASNDHHVHKPPPAYESDSDSDLSSAIGGGANSSISSANMSQQSFFRAKSSSYESLSSSDDYELNCALQSRRPKRISLSGDLNRLGNVEMSLSSRGVDSQSSHNTPHCVLNYPPLAVDYPPPLAIDVSEDGGDLSSHCVLNYPPPPSLAIDLSEDGDHSSCSLSLLDDHTRRRRSSLSKRAAFGLHSHALQVGERVSQFFGRRRASMFDIRRAVCFEVFEITFVFCFSCLLVWRQSYPQQQCLRGASWKMH